jgi:uncharacterized protein YjbI with pentapeptide repeats
MYNIHVHVTSIASIYYYLPLLILPPNEPRGADIRGAEDRGADIRGADVRGAETRGADGRDIPGPEDRGADGRDMRGLDVRGVDGRDIRGIERVLPVDRDARGIVLRDGSRTRPCEKLLVLLVVREGCVFRSYDLRLERALSRERVVRSALARDSR